MQSPDLHTYPPAAVPVSPLPQGPFTEMELLPYAQQYLQDYQTTFGIYNDMSLMYLVKWLRERYEQIQGLSEDPAATVAVAYPLR